jgi:hypothetical protein
VSEPAPETTTSEAAPAPTTRSAAESYRQKLKNPPTPPAPPTK